MSDNISLVWGQAPHGIIISGLKARAARGFDIQNRTTAAEPKRRTKVPAKRPEQAPQKRSSKTSAHTEQGGDLSSGTDEFSGGKPPKKRRHRPTSRIERMGFRVTAEEHAQIEYNALASGLSLPEFLRAVALAGPIEVPKNSPLWNPRLGGRLGRIGNNISQLLSHVDNKKSPSPVAVLARAVIEEIPLTAAYISRQKTPPADRGDEFFNRLSDPGSAINNIVTILHTGRAQDTTAEGAITHLEAIRQIMREVRSVR